MCQTSSIDEKEKKKDAKKRILTLSFGTVILDKTRQLDTNKIWN